MDKMKFCIIILFVSFMIMIGGAFAASPPVAPIPLSPGSASEPGQVISTLTPTLQWSAVSGADYYALAISKYPYGSSNIVYNPQQVYGTSIAVPSGILVPGEKYRWNMQAHNSAGWSPVSPTTLYFITSVQLTLYVHEDSASGPLLQGVLVTGTDGSGNSFSGTTGSSGYVIISGAPGTWQFTASKSGYATKPWSQPITITEERHAFISKTSVSPVTLTLYVHEDSASGPLLQGVLVTGTDGSGNSFSGTTGSSGYVIISGAPGTWQFTASKSGYATKPWSQPITITEERHAFISKTSVSPVTLTLFVHEGSETGPVLQGVLVTGTDGSGNTFSGTTDSSGLVVIDGASGTWSFTASKSGYNSVSWSNTITSSQRRDAYLQKNVDEEYYFVKSWGSVGGNPDQFGNNGPWGLAIDSSDDLYVASSNNPVYTPPPLYTTGKFIKFSRDGQFIWSIPDTSYNPSGIAVDSNGFIYLAEWGDNLIKKYQQNGQEVARFGSPGTGNGQFNYLAGIAVDAAGNVYAADSINNRIQKLSPEGNFLMQITGEGNPLQNPRSVAVDSAGNIYIGDGFKVRKFDSLGNIDPSFNPMLEAGGFDALTVDKEDNIYCLGRSYTSQPVFYKLDPSGKVLSEWIGIGSGDEQDFNSMGIAVDASGNVYISDYTNYRILKFAPVKEPPTTNLPPPPTLLVYGSESYPGTTINTLTPNLIWTPVPGADEYGLYIRDMDTYELIFDNRRDGYTLTGDTFSLPSGVLQPETHYRWNMNSHNSAGWNDDVGSGYSSRLYFTTPSGTQPEKGPVITDSLILSPGPYKVGDTITAYFTIQNYGDSAISFTDLTVGGRYSNPPFFIGDGQLPFNSGYPDFPHVKVNLLPGESYFYQEEVLVKVSGYYHFFCAYSPYSSDLSNWNCNIPVIKSDIRNQVDIIVGEPMPIIPLIGNGPPGMCYDILFIPDETYKGDLDTFKSDIYNIATNRINSIELLKERQKSFNFYYIDDYAYVSGYKSQENPPDFNAPKQMDFASISFVDAICVVHKNQFRDWAGSYNGIPIFTSHSSGTTIYPLIPNMPSFIHELGHALFKLKDEYCCDSYYFQNDPMPNIWSSELNCKDDAIKEGWDLNSIVQFCPAGCLGSESCNCGSGYWKIDKNDCIMGNMSPIHWYFGPACERKISWEFDHLGLGITDFGYYAVKVIELNLEISDNSIEIINSSVSYGYPPNNIAGSGFSITTINSNGTTLGTYYIDDPRIIYYDNGADLRNKVNFTIFLPFNSTIEKVEIKDIQTAETIEINVTPAIKTFCELYPADNNCSCTYIHPLIANFTIACNSGPAPLFMLFKDNSTGNITSRLWSFGDGTFAENLTEVTHIYSRPGNYTVTLTVSGPDGEDSVSAIITVQTPTEGIQNLVIEVESLGLPLKIQTPLISILNEAIISLDKGQEKQAINQLNAFIKLVTAQKGKSLEKDQAQFLIVSVQDIIEGIKT